jgi:hypothetical protein
MRILALDPATKTGYCVGDVGNVPKAGTLTLATPEQITAFRKKRLDRRQDPRPIQLYKSLGDMCYGAFKAPDLIVFEDVQFQSYTQQCQLWSSLRAAIWLFAHFHGVHTIDCLGVTKLKQYATGYGAADKDAMARALYKKHPEFKRQNLDDNGVDAAWLWLWASENFKRM